MNVDINHQCKHYGELEIKTTPHDHFLQYMNTTSLKSNRLSLITNILTRTHTPPSIENVIIQGPTFYYSGKDTIDTSRFDGRNLTIAQHQNVIG